MFTFISIKRFGNLLEIAPTNVIPLKTFSSKFSYLEVWLTDQNSQSVEIGGRINLALVIIWKMCYSIEPKVYVKDCGSLSFAKNIGKNWKNKYCQKPSCSVNKSRANKVATDAIQTDLKKAIEKTAERTGNLFGNKNVDKTTNVSNGVNGNEYIFIYEGYINIRKLSFRSL